jgi:quinol monooxygenase YgiN
MASQTTQDDLPGHLFTDIFRRADKNDDGKISKEEFFSFFADDHLSDEELVNMFNSIDTNKNQNLEVEEINEYFRKDFGPYISLFSAVASGHLAIKEVLQAVHQNYHSLDWVGQYKVRFYLQEYLNQVTMIHKPINTALKNICKSTPSHRLQTENKVKDDVFVERPAPQYSVNPIQKEVERLAALVSRIENSKIYLNLQEQIALDENDEEGNIIVSREHHVNPEHVDAYVESTRYYIADTKQENGCIYTYIKKRGEIDIFTLFEIWSSQELLHKHYLQPHYKTHAKNLIDFLQIPEKLSHVTVPCAWVQTHGHH